MLDRPKLIQQLHCITDKLFIDVSHENSIARESWLRIVDDATFIYKAQSAQTPWLIPTWSGRLDSAIAVQKTAHSYYAVSVDGSQIYPDRHQGTACFLINIGSVVLTYGLPASNRYVELKTEPYVFIGNEDEELLEVSPIDLVDCRRQELEFIAGLEISKKIKKQQLQNTPLIFLFDGSLIFWHLESKERAIKNTFLHRYCAALDQLCAAEILVAGYISLPKSKELVNLIRLELCNFNVKDSDAHKIIDHLVDTNVARFFLKPYTRSIVFKHCASISKQYPTTVQPYFFYLHVGNEIARIEIPAWIAYDTDKVDCVAHIIVDQCIKGRGYPIVLAEAHEQAVVKGPDREFFYHLIAKIGMEHKQRRIISQKSIKKRGIGI